MLEEFDKKKLVFSGILIGIIALIAGFFLFFNQKQLDNTAVGYNGTYVYDGTMFYKLDNFEKEMDSENFYTIKDFSSDVINATKEVEKNANREREIVIDKNGKGLLNYYTIDSEEKKLVDSYEINFDFTNNSLSLTNNDGIDENHKFKIIDKRYIVINYDDDSQNSNALEHNDIYKILTDN